MHLVTAPIEAILSLTQCCESSLFVTFYSPVLSVKEALSTFCLCNKTRSLEY